MRRQRSVSFYAETEKEYIEEYNKSKSISERRRCRSTSFVPNNEENLDSQKNNILTFKRKKFFQSYDDLELDQLGVNSTFQITNLEKEDSEENEGGLLQKINNINFYFKHNNNNSFFSNLAPFTKNIIGSLESKENKKPNIMCSERKNKEYEEDENIANDNLYQRKKYKINLEEENKDYGDDDYGNLLGTGCENYQIGYLEQKNEVDEPNKEKKESFNSIIENNDDNNENNGLCSLDNININRLNIPNSKVFQINDYNLDNNENENEDLDNNYFNNYKIEQKSPNKNNKKNNNNDSFSLSYNMNNFESNKKKSEIDSNIIINNNDKNDDKKMRRYTFDINAFIPDNDYLKEGEENESPTKGQNKTLQNYISKNEFLSKNIDFVDEHLKFLITGEDTKTKHLFLNQLLNEKSNYYEAFNICKKVIKLLGDYIKLELYEEECSLCYSYMLNTYIDFQDGVIFIININIPSSAKYIYDIIDKLKYKINKDKRHFNTVLFCFDIKEVGDFKSVDINKDENYDINNVNNIDINESIEIIDKIKNEFELKPNYITFYLNNKGCFLKNKKFELIINKFLSLAYLKKERKRKCKNSPKNKNKIKKHKRGKTGL